MTYTFGVLTDARGPLRVVWDFGDGTAKASRYPRLPLTHLFFVGDRECRACGAPVAWLTKTCPERNA